MGGSCKYWVEAKRLLNIMKFTDSPPTPHPPPPKRIIIWVQMLIVRKLVKWRNPGLSSIIFSITGSEESRKEYLLRWNHSASLQESEYEDNNVFLERQPKEVAECSPILTFRRENEGTSDWAFCGYHSLISEDGFGTVSGPGTVGLRVTSLSPHFAISLGQVLVLPSLHSPLPLP